MDPLRRTSTHHQNNSISINEHSRWYEPGADICFYEPALARARQVNTRLRTCRLKPHQKALLSVSLNREIIEESIRKGREEVECRYEERPSWRKAASSLLESLSASTVKLEGLLSEFVRQSPEAAIAWGCVALISHLIHDATEKESTVLRLVMSKLDKQLPRLELLQKQYPTDSMKAKLAECYIHVLDLLERSVEYCLTSKWGKIRDIFSPKDDYNFDIYIDNVAQLGQDMENEANIGHVEETKRILEVQEEVRLLIDRNYDQIKILRAQFTNLDEKQSAWLQVQAYARLQQLLQALLPNAVQILNEKETFSAGMYPDTLGPRYQWSNNEALVRLGLWRDLCPDHIFVVGSPDTEQISSLTDFSQDIVRLLRLQRGPLTFAFLHKTILLPTKFLDMTVVLKILIYRLLQEDPSLIAKAPAVVNEINFQTNEGIKFVFETLVLYQEYACIVIDRFDLCRFGSAPGEGSLDFLDYFIEIARSGGGKVKIVMTTAHPLKDDLSGVYYFGADTERRRRKLLI